jgi:hypothetical protein
MKSQNIIAFVIASAIPFATHAEFYKVNVKRIDKDLYKADSGIFIQTQYCYEYTYGDEAVLKYDQYSFDNKIIFNSGTTCDVKKVFK